MANEARTRGTRTISSRLTCRRTASATKIGSIHKTAKTEPVTRCVPKNLSCRCSGQTYTPVNRHTATPRSPAPPIATVASSAAAGRDCPGEDTLMRNQRPHNGTHATATRRLLRMSANSVWTPRRSQASFGRFGRPIRPFGEGAVDGDRRHGKIRSLESPIPVHRRSRAIPRSDPHPILCAVRLRAVPRADGDGPKGSATRSIPIRFSGGRVDRGCHLESSWRAAPIPRSLARREDAQRARGRGRVRDRRRFGPRGVFGSNAAGVRYPDGHVDDALRGSVGRTDGSVVGARGRRAGAGDARGAARAGAGRADHDTEDSVLQYPAAAFQLGGGPVERRRRQLGPGLPAPRSHAAKQTDAKAVMSYSTRPDRRSCREVPEMVHGFLTAGPLLPARPYSVNFRAI